VPKIIDEHCELVKLCYINRSGPVLLDTVYINDHCFSGIKNLPSAIVTVCHSKSPTSFQPVMMSHHLPFSGSNSK